MLLTVNANEVRRNVHDLEGRGVRQGDAVKERGLGRWRTREGERWDKVAG